MIPVKDLQTQLINYINENQFTTSPVELYDPVNYILSLGGKRLRPVLLLMAYNLFKPDTEKALPAAFAVELFHNFSLLHDDIMDEALIRRGKPSVHAKYGVNSAILSGDVMQIYVYHYLLKLEDKSRIADIISIFNQVAIDVCEGQQYDMNFETQSTVHLKDYLKMIELKTAVLIAGGLKVGAMIAGAKAEDCELLYSFGRDIGIAFQLQDDILDTYGDPEKFGKKPGGDIVQNKKTYLVLKTLELATPSDKIILMELMGSNPEDELIKINMVKTLFDKYAIQENAETLKESYLISAFDALEKVSVPSSQKSILIGLSKELMLREA